MTEYSVSSISFLLTIYDLRLVAKPHHVPMYLNIHVSAVVRSYNGSLSSLLASERLTACAAERFGTNYALLLWFAIAHNFFVPSRPQSQTGYV